MDSGSGSSSSDNTAPQVKPVRRPMTFAAQELRLISALVLLLATGLLLALPFVLSIGSVVFLPLVSAIILTIVLSPMAERLTQIGFPSHLAAFTSLLVLIGVLSLALTAVLSPAMSLYQEVPAMVDRIGEHFAALKGSLDWVIRLNSQVAKIVGSPEGQQVVLAGPSMLEQLALATPSVLVEILLTLLMTFFMVAGRVRLRRNTIFSAFDFSTSLKAAQVARAVQDRVAAYILTVGVINLLVGLVVATGAWLMDMSAPIMWGGLAALLNFLPYIGPLTMLGLLALFGLGTADNPLIGLIPAASYLGLHTVESNIVTPSILGARFTMNPVLILLALSYFSWIWGVTGALLSVPILLTITALIDHLGRPNLVGFIFGDPLFSSDAFEADETA